MNSVTPRVFIAATAQNDGKTTVSLGLMAALSKRFNRVGFIKPVGQRFVDVEGHRVDEDSFLIEQTFRVATPIEAMSPIAVEPDFTRRYIEQSNNDFLVKRLNHSFDRAAWEKDFVIVEGTGHAGVGSVFDLSNARVARLLDCKVILVTEGGIGRPIDETALNRALFEKEGVEVIGVVLNKVLPEKFDYVADFARRGLERLGMKLLGVIPRESMLAQPTLGQVARVVGGEFVHGGQRNRRKVAQVVVGTRNLVQVLEHLAPGALIITPADHDDVIFAALAASALRGSTQPFAGLALTGGMSVHPRVLELIKASDVPVLTTSLDSYTLASRIHSMTVKTLPGDTEKIQRIQELIGQHVDLDALLAGL